MEYQIQACLEETKNLDFISMGRPEGPGCYCMANNILREIIARLTSNYSIVVIDNEAGWNTFPDELRKKWIIYSLFPTLRPEVFRTIGRILELIGEMGDRVHASHIVLSRVKGLLEDLPENTQNEITKLAYPVDAIIPYDEMLVDLDLQGEPVIEDIHRIPVLSVSSQDAS